MDLEAESSSNRAFRLAELFFLTCSFGGVECYQESLLHKCCYRVPS